MKKRLSQIISIGLLAVIILLLIYNWKQDNVNDKLSDELKAEKELRGVVEEQRNTMEQRILADDLFIAGKYEEAMKMYDRIIAENEKQNLLHSRTIAMSRTDSLRSTLVVKDSEIHARINELRKRTDREIAEADSVYEYRADSIRTILLDEISRLKGVLAETREELQSKPKHEKLVFYSKAGNRTTYFGVVDNGKANGLGMGYYTSGNLYVGKWKDNLKNDEKGEFRWLSGERYEGSYVNDKRSGEGTYYWANGEKYVGEWENDERSGFGTLYDKDNNIKLKGQWKHGELVNSLE